MSDTRRHIVLAFGGRSPEHEVSVITALQAYHALKGGRGAQGTGRTQEPGPRAGAAGSGPDDSAASIVPFYVTKQGEWFTGTALFELDSYRDLDRLVKRLDRCTFEKDAVKGTSLFVTSGGGLFRRPRRYPIDAVVLAFHGADGENGVYQGLFESLDIPYTGSGVLGSALGMDKVLAKKRAAAIGVPVIPWVDFSEQDWTMQRQSILDQARSIGYPLILKPVHLGSSIGIRIVHSEQEIDEAVEDTFRYDSHLLLEQRVHPIMEINCAVRGDSTSSGKAEASVCERPLSNDAFLSFSDKYMSDAGGGKGMSSAKRVIPADIPDALSERIRQTSLDLYREFGLSGLARFDFILNGPEGTAYFNEVNTIPGSFSFYLWKEGGVAFPSLLWDMIALAKGRLARKQGQVSHFPTNLLSQDIFNGTKSFGKK